ncbi:MAG: HAD-like domain-containing protein [Linnemannia gamsii]|nr:MAG: HAD-like domain-containing protein [Linnemannia gamsii]
MSPTNMTSPPTISLHVYTDFDSTAVLTDTGNSILAHQIGHKELDRIDRLPETDAGRISLRKAEDMKWENLRLSVSQAADILVSPEDCVNSQNGDSTTGPGKLPAATEGFNPVPFDARQEQQQSGDNSVDDTVNDNYRVRLDPGFRAFHRYCQENQIPITIVSLGIQPLIEELLNRYLGVDHGIIVRANGLTTRPDGAWKVVWRDSSPFGLEKGRALREARAKDLKNPTTDKILWCGDGSSDFPAALTSDIVFARQNTSLEKLCRANSITHQAFVTFATVQDTVRDWVETQRKSQQQEQGQGPATTTTIAAAAGVSNGGVLVEP